MAKRNSRNDKATPKTTPVKKSGGKALGPDAVMDIFYQSKGRALTFKTIAKMCGAVALPEKNKIQGFLETLVFQEKLIRMPNGQYKPTNSGAAAKDRVVNPDDLIEGTLDHINPRFGFVRPILAGLDDVFIDSDNLNFAMDGDKVRVELLRKGGGGNRKTEGRIVEIVTRRRDTLVGTVDMQQENFAFIIADNKRIFADFYVKKENLGEAKNNDKVVIQVISWPAFNKKPEGKVMKVLGQSGTNDTEIHAIMEEYGLPYEFDEATLRESEAISEEITPYELEGRRDFRDITTFTIDPEDAKDFDDALSFRVMPNGLYEIGIHIADVSHYVKPGTELEKEAYRRATSVYLVDRTVPMLPEKLSNKLCSLRPFEDKLTYSAVFEMNHMGRIETKWFGRTVILSRRRFTYEEAQEVIETGEGDYAKELKILNDLHHKLRKDRMAKGAIGFETQEVKFKLDENGVPLGVYPKIRKDAHKLIEEFMLLANKYVAEFVYGLKKGNDKLTMVYRTHDEPDMDKVRNLAEFSKRFGHKMNPDAPKISSEMNKLVESLEGKPEQNVLQGLAIRCMAKAIYTTEPLQHFGLAFPHYTHFTSPIRRYPDVMVHRLLQRYLDGESSAPKPEYEDKCKHSSEREKLAAEAERTSVKYKQVEYMTKAINKIFDGMIISVTDFGMFVEITDARCEGLIRYQEMSDDHYDVDAKNHRIVGKRKGKVYMLGDTIKVKVKAADMQKRTIDLMIHNPDWNDYYEFEI